MRFLHTITIFILISWPMTAKAQNNILPSGATLLNISATERVEVEQDIMVANLRIEKRLSDASELQQEINMLMKQAIDAAKKIEGLDITTNQYYVNEHYNRDKKQPKMWQGSQGLTIKSKKAEDVLELSGRLQDLGFLMNGLNYQLSPEKREKTRDGLLEDVIKKLMVRARRVGSALDKQDVDLLEINVDAAPSMPMPQPMMMARSMAMDSIAESAMAAPVAQAGKNQISMTVSAKIILK